MGNFAWAEELWMRADMLIDSGRHIEAKRLLEEIIEEEPGYGRAHAYLGWYHYNVLSSYETAEIHLRYAVKFSPEYAAGYSHYLRVLKELRKYSELLALTNTAETVPGMCNATVLEYRANALEGLGNIKGAIRAYESAIGATTNEWAIKAYRANISRLRKRLWNW